MLVPCDAPMLGGGGSIYPEEINIPQDSIMF